MFHLLSSFTLSRYAEFKVVCGCVSCLLHTHTRTCCTLCLITSTSSFIINKSFISRIIMFYIVSLSLSLLHFLPAPVFCLNELSFISCVFHSYSSALYTMQHVLIWMAIVVAHTHTVVLLLRCHQPLLHSSFSSFFSQSLIKINQNDSYFH